MISLGKFLKPRWMTGRTVPKYKYNLAYHNYDLCKRTSQIYTPPHLWNAWLECFVIFKKGKLKKMDYWQDYFQIEKDTFMSNDMLLDICQDPKFNIGLALFEPASIKNGHKFEFVGWIHAEGKYKVALLQIGPYPAWLIPDAKGQLLLLDQYLCHKCCKYYNKKSFREHQSLCYICHCGQRQLRNDGHDNLCNREHWCPQVRNENRPDPEK